ncbi:hypothetical protein [Thermococcus sp. Bubb.Bath]|uniref:hypothetical protein n=1 Tax=Thermococcus sp. Bubb.Bath TaxID=1638242 RepID=UPI00143C0E10|nr:hypothetical protein [Thermococcus sp. Bubb.Bath]NJF25299.1 hypothetical protein [Thermococcus sp. Bubb.Bath]
MVSKKMLSLWMILNFIAFWAVWLYTTGYSAKGYFPGESERAEEYAPYIYTALGDQPVKMLYMVDQNGTIHYYVVWKDEHMGNELKDRIYRLFRKLIYRGSSMDIETVEINPEKREFHFETRGHKSVDGVMLEDGSCRVFETGETIHNCTSNGTHLKVYVVTWNHMLCLKPEAGTGKVEVELKKMSPLDYTSLTVYRRNNENTRELIISATEYSIVVTGGINVVLFIALKKWGENIRERAQGFRLSLRKFCRSIFRRF